ncbi:MAG: PepSY domain-containing protein [Veillonella sp.]|nr:PepSY domain-containing protein [Veillonella sp.]
MKSMFVKGGIALALAAAFGVNAPVVDAASIVPVQPTVAVVDANGANTLLNAFIQQHPKAAITEIAFDGEDGQIKYEIEGFDSTGKYELKYNYNTNQIGETKEGAYKVSLEKKAFDPTRILTPDAVVNFAFAQTKGQATSLNSWSVKNEKGRFVYDVAFGAANHQEIEVHVDAFTGELVSVKGVK